VVRYLLKSRGEPPLDKGRRETGSNEGQKGHEEQCKGHALVGAENSSDQNRGKDFPKDR